MREDELKGFESRRLRGAGAEIFARIGGRGPPLLLVHGYPQTHLCWAQVARELSARFTVVLCDLRGYGASAHPPVDHDAANYSKRIMAGDLVAALKELGYARFYLAGHDRGARVAYRLALDWPERVAALAVLAILPTFAMWRRLADPAYAMRAFRWYLLAQPAPLPQQLIEAAPLEYLHATLAAWTATKDLAPFPAAVLAAYETAFARPDAIAASCGDYRAGWTTDRLHDEADLQAGRRIRCPTLALWGRHEFPDEGAMLSAWREIAAQVEGRSLDCGHFLPEEAPAEVARALLEFFANASARGL
jgi:haloacetate dehalogenase